MKSRWIFLVLGTLSFLWFGGKGFLEFWKYARLKEHTRASIIEWDVVEGKSSQSYLVAKYSYEVQGKKYEDRCRLISPIFLNKLSAETELKTWSGWQWSAWYDPSAPQFSSLQKIFPYRQVTYGAISLGVLLYFVLFFGFQPQNFSSIILKKPR
jgi:hypothetical protein